MCYYAATMEEAYPWNGFCTFLIKSDTVGNLRKRL
jgi:hypothetical protein